MVSRTSGANGVLEEAKIHVDNLKKLLTEEDKWRHQSGQEANASFDLLNGVSSL